VFEPKNELPKIELDNTKDEELAHRYIIRLGKLLAPLRAIVPTWETKDTQGSEYAYAMAIIEEPSRAITQLRNLARGHALSKGRNYIKVEDIPMLIQVVLSTCSIERETIFEILIENKGFLKTSQIVDSLNITKPTALRTMTELKATGLVNMHDVNPGEYNSEKEICLKPEFEWFLSDKFAGLRANRSRWICKEKYPTSHTDKDTEASAKAKAEGAVEIETEKEEKSIALEGQNSLHTSSEFSKKDIEEWFDKECNRVKPLDPSYFAPTGLRCYYCEDFETDSKDGKRNYESHVKSKHGNDLDHPCYPSKADLKRLGLKPQSRKWEIYNG
jgi:hypothetical protein